MTKILQGKTKFVQDFCNFELTHADSNLGPLASKTTVPLHFPLNSQCASGHFATAPSRMRGNELVEILT